MQQQSLTVTFTCKSFFNVVTLNCCTILKPDESHNTAGSFFWLVQLLAIMSMYSSPSSGSHHHFRWTRKSHGRKCRAWIFSSSFFYHYYFWRAFKCSLKIRWIFYANSTSQHAGICSDPDKRAASVSLQGLGQTQAGRPAGVKWHRIKLANKMDRPRRGNLARRSKSNYPARCRWQRGH